MTMLPIKRILCSTDFSEPSLAALKTACELAQHFDAELKVLHAIAFTPPLPSDLIVAAPTYYSSEAERRSAAEQQMDDLIRQFVPDDVRVVPEVKVGYAAEEIIGTAAADNADLIVVGTHGETGWRHLAFGSVAEKVVRLAQRPVLTVHGNPPPKDE
jgi:nucleotide-binding universal stress UspA family protein